MENQEQKEEQKEGQKEEQKLETEGQIVPENLSGQGKTKKRKFIIIGIIVVLLLAGASLFNFLYLGHPSRQVLAKVNGEKITVAQFDKELANVENPIRDMYKEEPDKFLEGVIVKMLLLQEAKKQGLSVPAKTYKDTDKDSLSPEEFLISELMKKKFSSPPPVSREEIEAVYGMLKDRLEGKPLNQVAPMIERMIQEGKQREELEGFIKEPS